MKKHLILLLAALLLSGCGRSAPEPTFVPETTQVPVAETEPSGVTVVSEAPTRPQHTELEFYPEGMVERCPVTLYEGPGYSIYIPDGDYELVDQGRWVAKLNDQVGLEVVFYPGVTEEDIRSATTTAPLTQDEDGIWFMHTQDGQSWDAPCLDLWLYPAEDGVYAIFSRFFLEAAEGFGARMATVASTFELTE